MKLPVSMELANYGALGFDTYRNFTKTKEFKKFVKLSKYLLTGALPQIQKRAYKLRMAGVEFHQR